MANIDEDFPIGTRVQGVVNGKARLGTVVPKPEGNAGLEFASWHIPVKWDINATRVSCIHPKDITKI